MAQSPTQWSGSIYYDLRAKHADAVVFNRIGDLTLKGKMVAELDGFAGVSNQKGAPAVLGAAVLYHHKLYDQVDLTFGPAGSYSGGRWGAGFTLGASVRF